MNSFDLDGVIYMGNNRVGIRPGPNDIIITGRSKIDQEEETLAWLELNGISNEIYMNPLSRSDPAYSRTSSGKWKAEVLGMLIYSGCPVQFHYDDDKIQINEIKKVIPNMICVEVKHEVSKGGEIEVDML